jgi:ammonium transporter, Amt family
MQTLKKWTKCGVLLASIWLNAAAAQAQTAPSAATPPVVSGASFAGNKAAALTPAPALAPAPQATLATTAKAAEPVKFDGGDTAWMLICTVLVLLMTMPGIILFYSGMMRTKNALSIVAHTVTAAAVITVLWTVAGYSLAFTSGSPWSGDTSRFFAEGLFGSKVVAHPSAPTVPEAVFFMFQLAFAVITFALILGATVERMRLAVTLAFSGLWVVLVYAPVAHWIWHPNGWLATMGHMDFAGGTVVHVLAGGCGLAAAVVVGPRRGFGKVAMLPHNLLLTVMGAGILWAGWFGFNAGSAFAATPRAAGAVLTTQVGACSGAILWGVCEFIRRGQWSVLGTMTGAIAGLVAITPASGYVDIDGALFIGAASGILCFVAVMRFKEWTGIDDSLDVFALHGVGGLVGTMLTPVFADPSIAPVTATMWINTMGAVVVFFYGAGVTWLILKLIGMCIRLRVTPEEEKVGLDIAEHGEMLSHETGA